MPLSNTYDNIRHQSRFVILVSRRDLPKRLASAAMMLSIYFHFGETRAATGFALAVGMIEAIAYLLARSQPADEREMTSLRVLAIWALNFTSTIAYISPSFVLAHHGSVAMLLAATIWLFGIYVHISNTFSEMPFFNWSMMVPAFGAAIVLCVLIAESSYTASTALDWAIAVAMLLVYFFNTFETLTKQKDTQLALLLARREALGRLRELEHLSRHDGLTGLLNRSAFETGVEKLLADATLSRPVAVLLIDVDGFKPINDTYSHAAGDEVLIAVANRLRAFTGADGIAARFCGDEFAVALPAPGNAPALVRFAEIVQAEIEKPIRFEDKEFRITVSIGLHVSGPRARTVTDLCTGADLAMLRARNDPSPRPLLYDPARYPPRPSLEDRRVLSEALQSGEIRPFYQPKVALDTGRICGFEALARWVHPTEGVLPPGRFLPQINELGLQGDFLAQIATSVLRDVRDLVDQGLAPGQVSLNIPEVALASQSGRNDLDRLLLQYPLVAPHLTLEMTEDVFIARAADTIKASIAHFRAKGVRVSLDDFGTGFASFQHLRQLEFDELKIDLSFVAGLGTDPVAEVLIAGFLSMSQGLGVDVIAEGVETHDQRDRLLQMGCRIGQGFLWGKAMPLAEAAMRLSLEQTRDGAPAAADRMPPLKRAEA